jgi:hypothetical protein
LGDGEQFGHFRREFLWQSAALKQGIEMLG